MDAEPCIYDLMKVDPALMLAAATEASDMMKALANRHRLLLLCQLVDGERSVGELAEFLGIRDSTVSQHLALLRRDGIVAPRREAQTIYYGICSPAAQRVLRTLYDVYCAPQPICTPKPKSGGRAATRATQPRTGK